MKRMRITFPLETGKVIQEKWSGDSNGEKLREMRKIKEGFLHI